MSTAADVVIRQLTYSGERLLLGVELLDPDEFYRENSDGLSVAWVLGHLTAVTDLWTSWFTTDGELMFGRKFHRVFNETAVVLEGLVSKASTVNRNRYTKNMLICRFREAQTEAMRIIEELGYECWDDPAPADCPVLVQTGGRLWEILAVHTEQHLGGLAATMPRFRDAYLWNVLPHHLYRKRNK